MDRIRYVLGRMGILSIGKEEFCTLCTRAQSAPFSVDDIWGVQIETASMAGFASASE